MSVGWDLDEKNRRILTIANRDQDGDHDHDGDQQQQS